MYNRERRVCNSCRVIFMKEHLAGSPGRPRHSSMEFLMYPEGSKGGGKTHSGICIHCYIKATGLDPRDPILISIISCLDATLQEYNDSPWINMGCIGRILEDGEERKMNAGMRYYERIRSFYNLPHLDDYLSSARGILQQDCFCTYRGIRDKYLILNSISLQQTLLGCVCVKKMKAKKVCVKCGKPTRNRDSWCIECRKNRCMGWVEIPVTPEMHENDEEGITQCENWAVNPLKRLINDRLCIRCLSEGVLERALSD